MSRDRPAPPARGEGGEGGELGAEGDPLDLPVELASAWAMLEALAARPAELPADGAGRRYLTQGWMWGALEIEGDAERARLAGPLGRLLEAEGWKRGERIYRRTGEGKPTRERVTPYYLEEVGCPTCGAEVAEGKPHEAWCGRKGAEG